MSDRDESEDLPECCPTCGARLKAAAKCRRCKTDLGPLVNIAAASQHHLGIAATALAVGDFERMFRHASHSHCLRQSPRTTRLLACAALLTRRFDMAFTLWQQCG